MQETVHSKRFRLVEKDNYGIDLEYNPDFVALHITWVDNFNKDVYKDLLKTHPGVEDFVRDMGYWRIHLGIAPESSFAKKMSDRLGYKFIGNSQGWEIYEKEIV